MLEFRVLGPLEARGAAGEVALGGRKQSVLLAVLLLRAGEFVSREALIDALWPEEPPRSAGSTVESYVSRLRSALRAAGIEGEVIQSGPAGYRLTRANGAIDLDEFARLSAAARDALSGGDPAVAAASASKALELWRGPALAGLTEQPALRADVSALEEKRIEVVETLAEAALASGRESEVIPRLRIEVEREPAREHLRSLLMLALYQAGRQADALRAFQDARLYLVKELGLEPGPELRGLQERILRQDPSLDAARQPPARNEQSEAPINRAVRKSWVTKPSLRAAVAIGLSAMLLTAVGAALAISGGNSGRALARTLRNPAIGLLDATTGQPRAVGAVGIAVTRITSGGGSDWATSYETGQLLRLDPGRLLVTQTVAVGHGPTGVAIAAGDVWVAASIDGVVARVDLGTGGVVQRIAVGNDPTDLATADGVVWVSNTGDGTVSRIDLNTGSVLGTVRVGAEPRGIAVGAGGVWVADSAANVVVRLDPRSGRVLDRIAVGEGPTQVAVGRYGVWVANDLDSTVSLIDPATDNVTLTRVVAGIPAAIAPARDGVWVAAADRPTLTFVPVTGAPRQTALPSPATALAPTPAGPLVAVRGLSADHRGGLLVALFNGPIPSADPASCCDLPPDVRNLSYDGLLGTSVQPNSAGTLVPDLALAIPRPQAGGLVYTFRLRPGLRYWTGEPVRASDFRRGIELAAESNDIWAQYIGALPGALSCPRSPQKCNLSKGIVTDDKTGTVTLELSHPDPELLPALGLSVFAPAPSGSYAIRPGTGPYRITSFTPNDRVALERNPYFHATAPVAQPAGYPDRIEINFRGSSTDDITAVLDGRADYTSDTPSPAQLAQIELHEPGQLHISPQPELDYLFMNTHAAPFNDLHVRQALNYAVNRAAIVNLIGGPAAATPVCQTIPPTIPGHVPYCPYTRDPRPDEKWIGPDLVKARALIAASGTRGATVRVLTQPSGLAVDEPTAKYIVALLNLLGYHAHLRLLPLDQWQNAIDDYHHPAQIGTIAWGVDFVSASQFLISQLACAAWNPPTRLNNHAQFCDPQVDQLAQRAAQLQQTDPATADALWARADRLATNLAPWIPTVSENELDLVSRRAGDYHYLGCGGCTPLDLLWIR